MVVPIGKFSWISLKDILLETWFYKDTYMGVPSLSSEGRQRPLILQAPAIDVNQIIESYWIVPILSYFKETSCNLSISVKHKLLIEHVS